MIWLILGSLVVVIAVVGAAVEAIRDRLGRCAHGVRGAASNPTRCRECTRAAAELKQQRANEERRRAAAELRRYTEEEERKRAADERRLARVRHDEQRRYAEYHEQLAKEEREKEDRERKRVEEEVAAREREKLRRAEAEIKDEKRRTEYLKCIRLPSFLKTMDPREFELLVCRIYRKHGYDAQPTPYAGDGGVDGYLRREGKLYLLQCKRVKGSVGRPVLQQLSGCIAHHHAAGGIVVTTGNVSRQARQWAARNHINIVKLDGFVQMVRRAYPEDEVEGNR